MRVGKEPTSSPHGPGPNCMVALVLFLANAAVAVDFSYMTAS